VCSHALSVIKGDPVACHPQLRSAQRGEEPELEVHGLAAVSAAERAGEAPKGGATFHHLAHTPEAKALSSPLGGTTLPPRVVLARLAV